VFCYNFLINTNSLSRSLQPRPRPKWLRPQRGCAGTGCAEGPVRHSPDRGLVVNPTQLMGTPRSAAAQRTPPLTAPSQQTVRGLPTPDRATDGGRTANLR